jgi:hypothetical protein
MGVGNRMSIPISHTICGAGDYSGVPAPRMTQACDAARQGALPTLRRNSRDPEDVLAESHLFAVLRLDLA